MNFLLVSAPREGDTEPSPVSPLNPAHEGEGQHLIAVAAGHLLFDELLLVSAHTGHHVGKIRRGEQEKVLDPGVMVA